LALWSLIKRGVEVQLAAIVHDKVLPYVDSETSVSPNPGTGSGGPGERDTLIAKIQSAWRSVIRTEGGPDQDFFESGGRSLSAIQLCVAVSQCLGREVEPDLVYRHSTLSAFTDALLEQLEAPSR
jgi:hypothetical protein